MNNRLYLNLAMLALIAVLVSLVVFEPGLDETSPQRTRLTGLEESQLQEIRILRRQKPDLLFQRQGALWQMVEPVAVAVNPYRLRPILHMITGPSLGNFPVVENKLPAYGLAQPKLEIIVNGELHLFYGLETELDQRRYLRLDNQVHVVSTNPYYLANSPFTHFVDTALLPSDTPIQRIELDERVLQQQEGMWMLTPVGDHYSGDQIAALVEAWKRANAVDIRPYDGPMEGREVRIFLQGYEQPLRFLIDHEGDDLLLSRPDIGVQYLIYGESGSSLLQLSADSVFVVPDA